MVFRGIINLGGIKQCNEMKKKNERKVIPLFNGLLGVFQSGKLVTKMFQKIQELIDEKEALVFVLIDEVNLALVILILEIIDSLINSLSVIVLINIWQVTCTCSHPSLFERFFLLPAFLRNC